MTGLSAIPNSSSCRKGLLELTWWGLHDPSKEARQMLVVSASLTCHYVPLDMQGPTASTCFACFRRMVRACLVAILLRGCMHVCQIECFAACTTRRFEVVNLMSWTALYVYMS